MFSITHRVAKRCISHPLRSRQWHFYALDYAQVARLARSGSRRELYHRIAYRYSRERTSLTRTVPNYRWVERVSVTPGGTAHGETVMDALFVEGAPGERSWSMSLSGIFLSLHSPYPYFSTGHGETSRDSRTMFFWSERIRPCATWLVRDPDFDVRRIPVNNARDSPSSYFPRINYAGQEFMRRSDR